MNGPAPAARLGAVLPVADDPLECERTSWLRAEVSARRYARLHGLRHFPQRSAILMRFPPGTAAAEVRRVERCTRLLAQAGLPVPAIFASDPEAGWILQEDLGDRSLAAKAAEGANVSDDYREALELLPRIGRLGALDTSPDPPLGALRMRRELRLFVESALGPEPAPGPGLLADLERLVERCAAAPVALCHRDYHARNLMLHEGRVRVLDHQDALPGPAVYDRVSLAYDPYVPLDDALRDELAGDDPAAPAVAVQRLCKAIGTYASHRGEWLAAIAPAARQARRLLARGELRLPVLQAALAPLALRPVAAP